jgi:hypothetical protein
MSDRRGRRRAVVVGAVVAVAYLGLSALSGSLSPLARRPLLDGFGNLPAYRWVTPPPGHATGNSQPDSGRFVVTLDPQTGVEASVYYTKDNQITMAFQNGAIGPGTGQDSVVLTFTPLDPAGSAKPRAGTTIVGNVARIQGTIRPNGNPVTGLQIPAQVVLFYPAPATTFGFNHVILRSPDGKNWTALRSTDSRGQQLVSANSESLGYFAVGQTPNTTGGSSGGGIPIGTILIYVAVGGLAAFVLLQILRIELRRRRRAR